MNLTTRSDYINFQEFRCREPENQGIIRSSMATKILKIVTL